MESQQLSFDDLIAPASSPVTDEPAPAADAACRSNLGTFAECPLCGGGLTPEHAHFKCRFCGWRDSCCD